MRTKSILFVVVCLLAPTAAAGDNWPEFRGPSGDGHSDARGLALKWSEKDNVRWKTSIHDKGWSSPVIWDNQVWLTTARADGKQLFAVCVDRDTGKIIHDVKVFDVARPAFCHPFNSYASPTPVIEKGRVYVHYGSAGTACLDTSTGKVLWKRNDLPCDHWRTAGSSPILSGDLLILTFDGYDVQYLAALNKADGKTAWKTERDTRFPSDDGDYKKAYSTPTLIKVNGKFQLISPAAHVTVAYEPQTGKELWRVRHGGMNVSARPLYADGKLFLISGHDGKLLGVRADGKGDVTRSHVDWTFARGVPTRPSLLRVGELLYLISNNGVLTCVEAKTGKEVKKVRVGGEFSASPLYADGRIYLFDQGGTATVVEAGRELKVLATNKFDAGCMASAAVSGKALFVRTKTHLYRIEPK